MSIVTWIDRGLDNSATKQCLAGIMRRANDLGSEKFRASGGDPVWAKEDEKMLIRPHPQPPPWRNCETRVWKAISIFGLVCLCFLLRLSACFLCYIRLFLSDSYIR
ncbi:unnamed protein product [Cuscuta epithymum]|uniref:Uncharacterized protein n=1 Tax=Cuscuta epithymum TaxID=186058 RepID=A0AAV0FZU2_9ASTE|nr:unnamed protein product [Cuscuta epithymum]